MKTSSDCPKPFKKEGVVDKRKTSTNKHFSYKGAYSQYIFDESFKGFRKTKVIQKREILVDNKNSCYLGRHYIRRGERKEKFFNAPSTARDFYRCNKEFFKNFDIDVEKCVTAEGNWITNKSYLQNIAVPDESFGSTASIKDFRKLIDPIVKSIIPKIPFQILESAEYSDCKFVEYNKTTLSGFRYVEYLNFRTKDEASNLALTIAENRWNYIEKCARKQNNIDRSKICPGIYSVGARNKRDYTWEVDDEVKSRAVHMPEFHTEILSSCWIDPITEHLVECGRGAIYSGNTYLKYERYAKMLAGKSISYEGDWKGFDSTLYLNIILVSLSLLRCFYKFESDRIDKHFIAIFDTIGIKDYYTAGGYMYRVIHGLPSGIKATNLLGSIINLIALGFCTGVDDLKKIDFAVGGDDFIISPQDDVELDIDSMKERAKILGMEFKFIEKKYTNSKSVSDLPVFFKYIVKDGKPLIPNIALYERVFMPWNTPLKDIYDVKTHIEELFPSFSYPHTGFLPVYYYYAKILSLIRGIDVSLAEVLKYHEHINRKVFNRTIKLEDYYANDGTSKYICEGEKVLYTNKTLSIFYAKDNKQFVGKIIREK